MDKNPITPHVGMGATRCYATDRYPFTVVAVSKSGRRITLQEDWSFRTDSNGMSECQEYRYEPNTFAPLVVASLRKDGRWVEVGQNGKGSRFVLGSRRRYYDFSF